MARVLALASSSTQLFGEYSLVARVQLPEDSPPQLHLDGIETKRLRARIAVQAEAEGELDSLAQTRRRRVLQSDTQEIEIVTEVSFRGRSSSAYKIMMQICVRDTCPVYPFWSAWLVR